MEHIKAYWPENNSVGSEQVLPVDDILKLDIHVNFDSRI